MDWEKSDFIVGYVCERSHVKYCLADAPRVR